MSPEHIKMIPRVDHLPLTEAVSALTYFGKDMKEGAVVILGNTPGDFPWWRLVAAFGDRAFEITGEAGIYRASIERDSTNLPPELAQRPPFNGCRFVFWHSDNSTINVWPKGGENKKTIIAKMN